MTTKSAKIEMTEAREAMAAVLDAKLADMPEWRALRAIDRALLALETEKATLPIPKLPQQGDNRRIIASVPSYVGLTLGAISERGQPVTTATLMEYIAKRRPLGGDPEKAKINVTSSLSKDQRIESVPWEGGRAWWFADKPVPKKETAA